MLASPADAIDCKFAAGLGLEEHLRLTLHELDHPSEPLRLCGEVHNIRVLSNVLVEVVARLTDVHTVDCDRVRVGDVRVLDLQLLHEAVLALPCPTEILRGIARRPVDSQRPVSNRVEQD